MVNERRPSWSSRSRVDAIIDSVPDYRDFRPVEIPLADFRERWLPGHSRDGILVGLNWSGDNATGYDVSASDTERAMAASASPLSHSVGLTKRRAATRVGDCASRRRRSTAIGFEPAADRRRVGLDVVVAIDVELHQHQQPIEPFAVLERIATRVQGGGDRPRQLLER